ncbi:MAG: lauroyl acyltransferase [Alphaproteobacteria bacterium]|nr:lauroyl acyltransferase [Alphaproteobacteria bacterium]
MNRKRFAHRCWKKTRRFTKKLIQYLFTYIIQAFFTVVFCIFLRLISFNLASSFGGWLGRTLGPKLKLSWIARYNLMKVFPNKTPAEIDKIVVEMWDNLGRTFCEYPHLRWLCSHYNKRIEFVHPELIEKMRDDGKAGLLFSAHYGNWEVGSIIGNKFNFDLHRIFRQANNPYVEWAFRYFRNKIPGKLVPKGISTFRQIVEEVRKGGHFALMIDQKMNSGISSDFFGFPVMTTPSMMKLALKYNLPVLPVFVVRENGTHFKVIAEPEVSLIHTGNMNADIITNMNNVHHILEKWIKERPGQWLWLHQRWPETKWVWKKLYACRKQWKKGEFNAEMLAVSQKKHEYVRKKKDYFN